MSNDRPALVEMGANTREAPSGYNLDVSGTVGPDHLGQQTVDVDGHPCDRHGVRSRLSESSRHESDPRIARMDTGEELPVLLSSDMRAGPIEGTQGTYTQIVEGECNRCGYDRLKESVRTMAGERQRKCNACGARQEPRSGRGYSMPETPKERARKMKDAGPTIGSVHGKSVVDLEPDTGYGAMIALADDRSSTTLYKEDVEDLFWALADNGDIDLAESIKSELRQLESAVLAAQLPPDDVELVAEGD